MICLLTSKVISDHTLKFSVQMPCRTCHCCCLVCSVLSNSLWPHELYPELSWTIMNSIHELYPLSSWTGSSVHEILQARILEWVAISFSWGTSGCRDWTHISCIAGGLFTTEPPGKPSTYCLPWIFWKGHPKVSHTNLAGASLLWLPPSTPLGITRGYDEGSLIPCTNVRSGVVATDRILFTQQI